MIVAQSCNGITQPEHETVAASIWAEQEAAVEEKRIRYERARGFLLEVIDCKIVQVSYLKSLNVKVPPVLDEQAHPSTYRGVRNVTVGLYTYCNTVSYTH